GSSFPRLPTTSASATSGSSRSTGTSVVDRDPHRAPSVEDVLRIAAIANPVIRNLEITYCYSRLAAAFAARGGEGANWCTYATWASRQVGRTVRGEDLLEDLTRRLVYGRWLLHPIATLWRGLLRRGLFQRGTRI